MEFKNIINILHGIGLCALMWLIEYYEYFTQKEISVGFRSHSNLKLLDVNLNALSDPCQYCPCPSSKKKTIGLVGARSTQEYLCSSKKMSVYMDTCPVHDIPQGAWDRISSMGFMMSEVFILWEVFLKKIKCYIVKTKLGTNENTYAQVNQKIIKFKIINS